MKTWKERILATRRKSLDKRGIMKPKDAAEEKKLKKESHGH